MFDSITGELTAISADGVRLVLRVKVVRRHRGWARLVPASLQARVLAKDVLRQIAGQLTVDPPPVAPSRAGRPSKR